jgi:hypothetical protein
MNGIYTCKVVIRIREGLRRQQCGFAIGIVCGKNFLRQQFRYSKNSSVTNASLLRLLNHPGNRKPTSQNLSAHDQPNSQVLWLPLPLFNDWTDDLLVAGLEDLYIHEGHVDFGLIR